MAIRPDTDSKSPASRPGASNGELEQYGVWVKAEPRDITDEGVVAETADLDFDLPVETASLPEESFLSEDEEKLLGSFDADFESNSSSEAPSSLPDIEDLPPLDEPMMETVPRAKASGPEIEDLDSGTVDISLEELESSTEPSPISPYAEIDVEAIEGLAAGSRPAEPVRQASPKAPAAMEDVSAEFLDSIEEAAPADATESPLATDDVTAEFLDLEESEAPQPAQAPAADFEPIDIDLTFDDTLPSEEGAGTAVLEASSAGFEEVTEFDDFLAEPEELSLAAAPAGADQGSFDDLAAVERDLAAPPAAAASKARHEATTSPDILQKIAEELSSIRGELVSLKSQLNQLRPEGGAAPTGESSAEAKAAGGFFDEEEDETIALTGDELDNILNTADFTEEVAETHAPSDEDDTLEDLLDQPAPQDISILDESILPESGDYAETATPEPAMEELRLGESVAVEHPEPAGLPDAEEIALMAEEGVHPMTPAPEDTSYLESAEAGTADVFGEAPPEEAPLVEPDLSEFDLESEELGSQEMIEIDEELPVVESAETDLEELTLGMEAGPGYGEEAPAEIEAIEPLPEIEETSLEEIDLHHEEHGKAERDMEELPEVEELSGAEEADILATEIEERTIRPAEPIGLHPDEIPTSLDDSFFVGEETLPAAESPLETEEELVLDMAEEPAPPPSRKGAPIPVELPMAEEMVEGGEEGAPSPGDERLKAEIRSVLAYLDKLLDSLPEDKIEEFAKSEHFDTYKRLFEELGLV